MKVGSVLGGSIYFYTNRFCFFNIIILQGENASDNQSSLSSKTVYRNFEQETFVNYNSTLRCLIDVCYEINFFVFFDSLKNSLNCGFVGLNFAKGLT